MASAAGFWALRVEPKKIYTQELEESFLMTMAALDHDAPEDKKTTLYVKYEDSEIPICTLKAGKIEQQPLNITFKEGEEVSFLVKGDVPITVSGNYIVEEEFPYEMEGDDEDLEDDEDISIDGDMEDEEIEDMQGSEEDEDEEELDEEAEKALVAEIEKKRKAAEEKEKQQAAKKQKVEEKKVEKKADNKKKQKKSEEDSPMIEASPAKANDENKTPSKATENKKKVESPASAKKAETPAKTETEASTKKTLPNGLVIEDVQVGKGPKAKPGKNVYVRYIGKLTNGKVFDSNTKGAPFNFKLGGGQVIKGWDTGVAGMHVGGTRKLTIPPALAYGKQGAPPDIPKNATLVFEIKLLDVK